MMIKPTTTNVQQVTQELKPAPRGPDARSTSSAQAVQGVGQSDGIAAARSTQASAKSMEAPAKSQPPSTGIDPAIVDRIAQFAQSIQRDLQFSIDKSVGKTVIKVVDSTTQEVIRQIPSDEALAITRHLKEQGILFNSKA